MWYAATSEKHRNPFWYRVLWMDVTLVKSRSKPVLACRWMCVCVCDKVLLNAMLLIHESLRQQSCVTRRLGICVCIRYVEKISLDSFIRRQWVQSRRTTKRIYHQSCMLHVSVKALFLWKTRLHLLRSYTIIVNGEWKCRSAALKFNHSYQRYWWKRLGSRITMYLMV